MRDWGRKAAFALTYDDGMTQQITSVAILPIWISVRRMPCLSAATKETGMVKRMIDLRRKALVFMTVAGLAASAAAAHAGEIPAFADRIVSASSGDVNGDGEPDLVLLLTPDEAAGEIDHGLLLFLGGEEDRGQIAPQAYYPDMVWGGLPDGMVGNRPSVDIAANGSIRLFSHNDAIGRSRWSQTLTLAWRKGRLLLAGFSYESRDTLTKGGDPHECDVNLLTGKGVREVNGEREQFSVPDHDLTVTDWARYRDSGFCGFDE